MVRSNYTFANSAADIRALLDRNPDMCHNFYEIQKEVHARWSVFSDNADRLSGWAHDFICPKCASQMIFDPDMAFDAPHVFTCPRCGTQASGEVYDAAWVYYYRSAYGNLLEKNALCALLGDETALADIIRFVDFYADHYAAFPVHGKHAGKGKIMEQSLCEAVFGISILRALTACGSLIPEEKRLFWSEKLFVPMAELLLPQADAIHNIPTWLMCCVGMIGLYCKNDALLDKALNSETGLRRQIELGYTADGFWHEGSLLYHYYTTEALTYFLGLYALSAPDDPIFDRIEAAYTSPLALSEDGLKLQSINDGWYPLTIGRYASLILRACRLFDSPELARQVDVIRQSEPDALNDAFLLLYGIDAPVKAESLPAADSVVYGATNLAVMRQPFYALLKSGVLTRSHAHCDYLSLVMPPFSDDLGTPGYAHSLTRGWYRLAASHNVVCIDGTLPHEVVPSHVEARENGIRAVLDTRGLTNEALTLARRTLTSDGIILHDCAEYAAEKEHVYDWFFHGTGSFSCNGKCEPRPSLGTGNGYEHIKDLRRVSCEGMFIAEWQLDNGRRLFLFVPETADTEIYTANTPDNPADADRHAVILRKKGNNAVFDVAYRTEVR